MDGQSVQKPLIAVPIGDPAGIGPEIVAKAFADEQTQKSARCLAVGDRAVMERALRVTKSDLRIHAVQKAEDGVYERGILNMLNIDNIDEARFAYGKVDGMCGRAAYEYIAKSVELALQKKVSAVATTPINKESLKAGGVNFIGHTEIFASLTNTKDPLTMFQVRNLRIFFLTRHVSLRQACDMVKKERIKDYVKRCFAMLKSLGVETGTMAVAGLNPHSGEHGLFGSEEVTEVAPAVRELTEEGFPVCGPVGADSVFHLALQGKFNSVLSLYHDQGHIAAKTLDFERTVSITGGMSILRTSVDHGTAFDIAGTGQASSISMIEAIRLAALYSPAFIAKKVR